MVLSLSCAFVWRPRLTTYSITNPNCGVFNSQTISWTIIKIIAVFRLLHTSTSHTRNNSNKPYYILIIMQQKLSNCVRQNMVDSVLKSSKAHSALTGNRNGFAHAQPDFTKVAWASPSDKFVNRISNNPDFDIFVIIEIQNGIDQIVSCIYTEKETIQQGTFHVLAGVEASVTWHMGLLQWRP